MYSPCQNSPGQNTGVGSLFLLQGNLPNPGIKPRSPTLQADSLPAEPQGKPKNTGVGSLSLLQRIFPTQGWNPGLLHCRWRLYQLSYQGSPPAELFQIPKDDAVKCCTQYSSKFGKLSSGHRTGKCQLLFQSQSKAMPKNVQNITQL